ncbi:MAG TPA: beta-ketoacyl-ACP synthase 3, partial [Planctomycetes bacterium]|nr:beta-ketoacyl-ACP synthase 3 [Planctomycetota bacterium]
MPVSRMLQVFRSMVLARELDRVEQEMVRRGEASFHVSGGGHESTAVLASLLHESDFLHLHYRDKALMIARGMPMHGFFDALLCNERSTSGGRNMVAHFTSKEHNVVSMPTPVSNNGLHACGVAAAIRDKSTRPIVYCANGDGTTQQGEFYEAIAEAARENLPVLFMIQDNGLAISTSTVGRTFYRHGSGCEDTLHGVPIHRCDGRNPVTMYEKFSEIIATMREDRRPVITVLDVERLSDHTNADDQRIYRTEEELATAQRDGDPVRFLRGWLLEQSCSEHDLLQIERQAAETVAAAEVDALSIQDPILTTTAKVALPVELTHPSREVRGEDDHEGITMKEAMRRVFQHWLENDDRVTLCGQDIEDPKGDVFGVTKGLSTQFPGRVINAPLSEATIVGSAVGRALAGERPVAFLQFADFVPMAFNQIACEMSSMDWRSNGQWHAPVVLMAPYGAYRPGLGPFHSHSMEAIIAHCPGLDVFIPSTAADAAGMVNAALQSARPSVIFYPKSLLNDPAGATTAEGVSENFAPIGVARKIRAGRDITLVGWGNTVKICREVAETLEQVGREAEVIDLRSISPWDERMILASAEKTAHLLVVHEDNEFCGLGAEIVSTVAERARMPVAMRRVARPNTFIPCNINNQLDLLPSYRRVLEVCGELLDLEVEWPEVKVDDTSDRVIVEAVGSGPADEAVEVVELFVEMGQHVRRGDVIASLEATKSVFDLTAPMDGIVEAILAEPGQSVPVGDPLLTLRPTGEQRPRRMVMKRVEQWPKLIPKTDSTSIRIGTQPPERRSFEVGMSFVSAVAGSRVITNDEVLKRLKGRTSADVIRRTGIERRHWASEGETAVTMAASSCQTVLENAGLMLDDIDLVICATTSPTSVTPSMACQVVHSLTTGKVVPNIQAYDINAACSGYLYALQSGYDFLQSTPESRVLLVTAEVLSPLLNLDDFDTAILFGDATSATILYGESHIDQSVARIVRPEVSARGEDGSALSVPLPHDGYIQMRGRRVFTEAVRAMVGSLNRVCTQQQLRMDDLRMVVPHQANQRIIDAIQSRVGIDVYSNIRNFGNTSSTSIPLCLSEVLPECPDGERLGLCAFGGGFTFGAGILQRRS